jgi:cytochrome o ubiquinol oxidase operon protein cyoD
MSGHQNHPSHAEEHGHDHHADHSANHGTLNSYIIGFVLAVILTAIPFWLVMNHVIEKSTTAGIVLLVLAAVQVVVHMVYFLHMNSKSEGGWTILALIFTLTLVVILLAGSVWVMYHMNQNMMPSMSQDLLQEAVPGSMQHNMPGMK